jgi:tyrosine-specific transport protein
MVGAGVLALPAVSSPCGFVPATFALIATWGYMVAAALLGAEVSAEAARVLDRPGGVSLLSQARLTLGPAGAALASCSYLFLHVIVLVAYVSEGSGVLERLIPSIPHWLAGTAFLSTIGGVLYAFDEDQVDSVNNVLFALVVASFGFVLAQLVPGIHVNELTSHSNWAAVPKALPTLLLACVFHNIVSSTSARMNGDTPRVTRVVLLGSSIPLAMFIVANAVVLSAVGTNGAGVDPLVALSDRGGMPAFAIDSFAALAVTTSAIGFITGLNDLWTDARISLLQEEADSVAKNPLPSYSLSVIPPVVLSALMPGSFLAALDAGGLYGVSVLFGIIPAVMAWRQRYTSKARSVHEGTAPNLPGGKLTLAAMIAAPCALIVYDSLGM